MKCAVVYARSTPPPYPRRSEYHVVPVTGTFHVLWVRAVEVSGNPLTVARAAKQRRGERLLNTFALASQS
jgi:hypothetical protein